MKRILRLLRRVTRRTVAQTFVLIGGSGTAAGAALIYVPAGIMLGGVALIAWALLLFDVDGTR